MKKLLLAFLFAVSAFGDFQTVRPNENESNIKMLQYVSLVLGGVSGLLSNGTFYSKIRWNGLFTIIGTAFYGISYYLSNSKSKNKEYLSAILPTVGMYSLGNHTTGFLRSPFNPSYREISTQTKEIGS